MNGWRYRSIFAAMADHGYWMRRCLQLARNGMGTAAPNPLVGAVLVQGDRVLAEGWHRADGGPHAEVECLRAFGDGPVPADAVIYVNLEPCAHHGRTPPCADLLIARQVRTWVVGCGDPDPRVQSKGIARAREAGIQVIEDVLRDECRWLNRRYLTAHEQQRPYIIVKWAQTADGLIDSGLRTERTPDRISGPAADVLVHRWRSEEQAILVGSRTVVNDDPQLTVRLVEGRSPLRVILDRRHLAPASSRVFDGSVPTLLITSTRRTDVAVDQLVVPLEEDPIDALLAWSYANRVRSLFVEGGTQLLEHFIRSGRWDEARVITGRVAFGKGTRAPQLDRPPVRTQRVGEDLLAFYANTSEPAPTWAW